MAFSNTQKQIFLFFLVILLFLSDLCFSTEVHHDCDGHHHHPHHHHHDSQVIESKLPEEFAEEEDMKLYGFSNYHHSHAHDHHHHRHDSQLAGLGLWSNALGCSLLVSLASLICLIILPVIFIQGKPSKTVVDSLALFGAGAMLGDAFLHQLPHAFGGLYSHSHDHDADHSHHSHDEHGHSHAHSLKDLSIGLSILAGIVLFLLVEKVVIYVEDNSSGAHAWNHGHHHHHHKSSKKLKDDDNDVYDVVQSRSPKETEGKDSREASDYSLNGDTLTEHDPLLRKRKTTLDGKGDVSHIDATNGSVNANKSLKKKETAQAPSKLVFGYLNLFSDGVHNFIDGMALGSAFLLYGSVGGWSRTLFLLAHELPQEAYGSSFLFLLANLNNTRKLYILLFNIIGDFGILVRSGFSVSKALFFNFLSALVALLGTALALLWGQDPGQSSLIEGFTAGGFIYIAVAGVLAEMNNSSSTIRSSAVQIISLVLGMAVALCISLVE